MRLVVVVTGGPPFLRDSLLQVLSTNSMLDVRYDTANVVQPLQSFADVVLFVAYTKEEVCIEIAQLHAKYPRAKLLLLLLAEDDALAQAALRLGVEGIADSNAGVAEVVECVKRLGEEQFVLSRQLAQRLVRQQALGPSPGNSHHNSNHQLTDRELEVLRLLAEGATNRAIATQLSLSEHTVRAHLRVIMQKLQVTNRVQAAARAWQGHLFRTESTNEGETNGNPGGRR